jgi:hypothetical protein
VAQLVRAACLLGLSSLSLVSFFSPFLWVLSFYKVWHGFIILVASEAIKDIFIIKTLQNFPLRITVAFHYVFPPNSLWVKHAPIQRTLRVISENVIIVKFSSQIFY